MGAQKGDVSAEFTTLNTLPQAAYPISPLRRRFRRRYAGNDDLIIWNEPNIAFEWATRRSIRRLCAPAASRLRARHAANRTSSFSRRGWHRRSNRSQRRRLNDITYLTNCMTRAHSLFRHAGDS